MMTDRSAPVSAGPSTTRKSLNQGDTCCETVGVCTLVVLKAIVWRVHVVADGSGVLGKQSYSGGTVQWYRGTMTW